MKYKFPRKLRLTTEDQFKQVYKARKKTATEIITIYYCCNENNYPRLGVIVPKRNIKSSSKRNYFKRIIREIFRLNQFRFGNVDIVIFVNSKAEYLPKKELISFLGKQLGKVAYD